MNADTAKRIAKNKLPCTCGYKSLNDVWIERSDHVALCPAYFRETISLALLEAARMPLFRSGDFTLHSGDKASWKIDCDVLTDADLETLAAYAVTKLKPFSSVVGVPTGGLRFAKALQKYVTPDTGRTLIADDVLTTGSSMEGERVPHCEGVVIFARGPCPDWITPLLSCAARMPTREQITITVREAMRRPVPKPACSCFSRDPSAVRRNCNGVCEDAVDRVADAIITALAAREKP